MASFKVSIYGMPIPQISDENYFGPNNEPTINRTVLMVYKPNDIKNRKLYYRPLEPQGFTSRYRVLAENNQRIVFLPEDCDRSKFIAVFKNRKLLFQVLEYEIWLGRVKFKTPLTDEDEIIFWYTKRIDYPVIVDWMTQMVFISNAIVSIYPLTAYATTPEFGYRNWNSKLEKTPSLDIRVSEIMRMNYGGPIPEPNHSYTKFENFNIVNCKPPILEHTGVNFITVQEKIEFQNNQRVRVSDQTLSLEGLEFVKFFNPSMNYETKSVDAKYESLWVDTSEL